MRMIFPVAPVECINSHRIDASGIQTSNIDTVAVRIRARNIERLDATTAAEEMLGNSRVELIGGNVILTADEREIIFSYNQMQVSAHTANTAIALIDLENSWCLDFEFDAAAVTAACVNSHLSFGSPFFLQTASKLLAGMAYSLSRRIDRSLAKLSSSSRSRIPISEFRSRKDASNR